MNNEVRELFKSSISEMFGGVDKIPASVKSVMKFGDFGKGKPLTVRRIIAVNTAIEKLKIDSSTFKDAFDAELNGKIPDFTITEIKQEVE